MALNIPMPGAPGAALLSGLDTGSTLMSRIMNAQLDREKLKQQQNQFMQDLLLRKQAEQRSESLLPYMIQQYKDTHNTAANAAQLRQYIQNALSGGNTSAVPNLSGTMPQSAQINKMPVPTGVTPNAPELSLPDNAQLTPSSMPSNQNMDQQEHELHPGNPRLMKLDAIAGLVPGIPKPIQHFSNGVLLTTYPSGRVTIQHVEGENSVLHGPARDAADLDKLKQEVGENSEVYQNAKAAYDAQLDARKDLRDLRARTKAGIKPGEKEFFDPNSGKPLGKEVPFTEKERESEEGNILFNELYPIVYKGAAPFSGEGSITRLEQAAANYKTDPRAKKMFDDFLLANKMLAATTVNEASTLKARSTNTTYQMLKSSLDAQDIPNVVSKLISQYRIPASAQMTAAMRYQKALSDARIKAHKNVPATKKLFYDPTQQEKYEQQLDNNLPSSSEKEVIVIDPNNKRYKTTEANAAHLPKGWKRG